MNSMFWTRRLFVSLIVLPSAVSIAAEPVGGAEWKAGMRSMLGDVVVLLPYAFDEAQFRDPKNSTSIRQSLHSLTKHAADLKKHTSLLKPADSVKIDPSFPFMAEAFANEVEYASETFDQGSESRSQSQAYLRSAISKCMHCHTQSEVGPELKLETFNAPLSHLAANDRFIAFAATRQFDAALKEFAAYASSAKDKKLDGVLFDRMAHVALAIVVRVKKSPSSALTLIGEIEKSGAGSNMLRSDLKGWRLSSLAWQKEKPVSTSSDLTLFTQAKDLSVKGWAKRKSLEAPENTDVLFLRASANLHELLTTYPKSQHRAQAYLLLASVYQALPGFAMWDLGDEYLGACIVEFSHSEMGEKCYKDYSESVTAGYTGSAGTHIPKSVQNQLSRMKDLAFRSASEPSKAR